MKLRGLIVATVAVFGLALMMDSSIQGGDKKEDKKEPVAIKVIMKKAHTAPKGEQTLLKKVTSGKATAEEKKQLIALYTDLAANDCPKGEPDDWKQRTANILKAAKADDTKALSKATTCAACHSLHK